MKINVYSTPTCPYCVQLKEFLKEHDIEFNDIDVSTDQAAAAKMVEKTGQMGVPVTEIGDEFIVGFDEAKIREKLNIK
ncbi:glutaredoxin family protein [Patescibacteria group bacterium]|nr:glutaredoxin family protein [Patescibacteria group bacterium]